MLRLLGGYGGAAAVQAQLAAGALRNEAALPEMRRLLGLAGTPCSPRHMIHVAGTKGKGTTCAYLERLCRAFGLRTGLFTSPHLVDVRERIRLDGRSLGRAAFVRLFEHCHGRLAGHPAGFFQLMVLLAWRAFHEQAPDVAVVEVGIGGRFDATNVAAGCDAVAITSLAMDHEGMLGHELAQIAWHKAGIIKVRPPRPGRPRAV